MSDYALCEVENVTTSGMELLLDRPLREGTVVTILVRPEGSPGKYYRVIGIVQRREKKHSRWLHVVRASSKRPWSSMFIYDVIYQALTGEMPWPVPEWMYMDDGKPGSIDGGLELYGELGWLAPFDELNDLIRRFLARKQQVVSKPAGATLIKRGSFEDDSIYLVEGTVRIEPYDGKSFQIAAGTRNAHFPVSVLRPHAYTVTAVSDVAVVLLSRHMLEDLARIAANHGSHPGIEVSEGGPLPEELTGAW